MTPRLLSIFAVMCLATLLAAGAHAGLNAGGTAQIYWQNPATGTVTAARAIATPTPQMVVTVKGVTNFRGADVQLLLNGISAVLPPAWQCQAGGCNQAGASFYIGGHGGNPNIFTASPALPGLAVSQDEELYNTGDCLTPHGIALFWLTAAGASGVARTAGTEYAVWAIALDLRSTAGGGPSDCDGDYGHAPVGICINPNERIPCNDLQRGYVLAILDGNDVIDYLPFAAGKTFLEWWVTGDCCPGNAEFPCISAAPPGTWGWLRRIYR